MATRHYLVLGWHEVESEEVKNVDLEWDDEDAIIAYIEAKFSDVFDEVLVVPSAPRAGI